MGSESGTPLSYQDAVNCEESDKWQQAMQEEMHAMAQMKTWNTVPLPRGARPVKSRWVFVKKLDANGDTRYRARLVAKGFTQRYGIDYHEVFSPVAKYSTLRWLLSKVAQNRLTMLQLDVKTALLNGILEADIYMQQPEGLDIEGKSEYVMKLNKAVYGIKQASRTWYNTMNTFLCDSGFHKSDADPGLYISSDAGGHTFILVYVDDILVVGPEDKEVQKINSMMSSRFDVRVVEKFLGISVQMTEDGIKIHNGTMVRNLVEAFGMQGCRSASTPFPPGTVLNMAEGEEGGQEASLRSSYQQLVGSLSYLANTVRPDIAYAVGILSRYMHKPGPAHLAAAKHVLRYLSGTKEKGITYLTGDVEPELVGYTDADFAGDTQERRSTSGFVFISSGGAIYWRSKNQSIVAQTTVEAEYVALSHTVREALWLRKLIAPTTEEAGTIPIYCDNQGALSLSQDDITNERTKHIIIKYHFVKDHVQKQDIDLKYIPTGRMIADIQTKALGNVKHSFFCAGMGIDKM